VTIAPDGTIIAKNQTRAVGFAGQGTLAIVKGVLAGFKQPNSHLVALNPETLEILDDVSLPEPATVPHIITMFEDKIAIYIGVDSGALRYFWDPATKKLSQDTSWVAKPMEKGQTTPDAPNMKKNVEAEPMFDALFTGNYKEQVTWRDAATGRLIAESDFFEPMTFGSLIAPGFGGRVYFATGKGFITLQVVPATTARK
jgi:hypothetical protein